MSFLHYSLVPSPPHPPSFLLLAAGQVRDCASVDVVSCFHLSVVAR